jgi:hypothetical protein
MLPSAIASILTRKDQALLAGLRRLPQVHLSKGRGIQALPPGISTVAQCFLAKPCSSTCLPRHVPHCLDRRWDELRGRSAVPAIRRLTSRTESETYALGARLADFVRAKRRMKATTFEFTEDADRVIAVYDLGGVLSISRFSKSRKVSLSQVDQR